MGRKISCALIHFIPDQTKEDERPREGVRARASHSHTITNSRALSTKRGCSTIGGTGRGTVTAYTSLHIVGDKCSQGGTVSWPPEKKTKRNTKILFFCLTQCASSYSPAISSRGTLDLGKEYTF